jgi:rod shape-determining protein MreD
MSPLRALIFFVVTWMLLIVSQAVTSLLPAVLRGALPEIALLVVLYLTLGGGAGTEQRAPAATTLVVFALAAGYLTDLLAGAPRGLHAFTLGLAAVLARSLESRLDVSRSWQEAVVALIAAAGCGAITVALSAQEGDALSALAPVPLTALVTALCAPPAFKLFRRIDRGRVPRPGVLRL